MDGKVDYVKKKFGPLCDKTLQNALANAIRREFPRIGGPRIQQKCAQIILEIVEKHLVPSKHVCHGQVLWSAVDKNDPPAQYKRIADTNQVPVILELSTVDDIDARVGRKSKSDRLTEKAIRLCRQAYEQGGLLSNCDLAELLGFSDSAIARMLTGYEAKHQTTIPRRATLHDVGTGVTHKGIICYKRYAEGKESKQIATETFHSLKAVDRYLGQFDRVRSLREQQYSISKIAYLLNCGTRLVEEYMDIDDKLKSSKRKDKK